MLYNLYILNLERTTLKTAYYTYPIITLLLVAIVMTTGCGPASTSTNVETGREQLEIPVADETQGEVVQTTKANNVSLPDNTATPDPAKTIIKGKDSTSLENTVARVYDNDPTETTNQTEDVSGNSDQNQVNVSTEAASTATPEPTNESEVTQKKPEEIHDSNSSMPVSPIEPVVIQPTEPPIPKPEWPEAPDFSLPSAQGNQISLSEYEGDKHTILVFYRAYW